MKNIIKILIGILLFILPLINSYIIQYLGLITGDIFLGWEFPKVLFFLVFSGIINLFFLIYVFKNKLKYNYFWIYFFLFLSILSTIFAPLILNSTFSFYPKGHSLLMFFGLASTFIIINEIKDKKFINKLFLVSSVSFVLANMFGILNYFYNFTQAVELSSRNFATFGHPNYLALFTLILLPFWLNKYFNEKSKLNLFFLIFNFFALILAKTYLALFLFIVYFVYFLIDSYNVNKKYFYYFLVTFVCCGIIILSFDINKANSFLSRFFIWQASLEVIFSDIKNIFFGLGFENLGEVIVNHKNKMLYIFENFGFFPDRPHNIFLLIFSTLGIFGLALFSYFIFKIYKSPKSFYKGAFALIIIFLCFNFPSISSYLLIILLISQVIALIEINKFPLVNKVFVILISLLTLGGGITGLMAYYSKIEEEKGNYELAYKLYPFNLENKFKAGNFDVKNKSISYYKAKLNTNPNDEIIKEFLDKYNSVETFIFVGDVLYNLGETDKAVSYYKKGIEKLEQIINSTHPFDFLISEKRLEGAKRRLYSERYGLEKVLLRIKAAN